MELRGLDKVFPGTHALDNVDLGFEPGEIHAIVGENGAGKSTLIKILTGVYRRTAGRVLWEGEEVDLPSPTAAMALGINAVHQEVVLCPHLSVAANIFLGREDCQLGFVRERAMVGAAEALLDDLGFDLSAAATLESLTIGQQQLVAVARAESRGIKFLIFDEPTAYLARQEVEQLFRLIRGLNERGVTIVYISHRLEEVFELADRVSVLRDGRHVVTRRLGDTNEAELIRDMAGRDIEDVRHKQPMTLGAPVLEVAGFGGDGFRDISLTVRRGEVVGLYGLVGAGRSEFVRALYGGRQSVGEVKCNGQVKHITGEADAIASGLALVPESRRDQGLCLNLSLGLNLNLPSYARISPRGMVDTKAERARADAQMDRLAIKADSRAAEVATLSGGNQQKVMIGKWLGHGADLYIFDEPTVGVDVATKVEIYRLFGELLAGGAGILLISSHLPEVFDLSDTLHVFRDGSMVASHDLAVPGPAAADHEVVLAQAIGA